MSNPNFKTSSQINPTFDRTQNSLKRDPRYGILFEFIQRWNLNNNMTKSLD